MEQRSEGFSSRKSSSTEEQNLEQETTNTDDHSDDSSLERNNDTEEDDCGRNCVAENGQEGSYSSAEKNSEYGEEKYTDDRSEPSRTSSRMSERKLAYQNGSHFPNVNNTSLDISEWMEEIKTNLKLEHSVLIQTLFKDYENLNELKQVVINTTKMCKEYDNHLTELCEKIREVKGILKNLHVTMDKKLSEEGLKSWMGDSTNYDLGKKV